MLTQERLKQLLWYDPETGLFVWVVSTSNRATVGSPAGTLAGKGWAIGVDGTVYLSHRLAWLYVTGSWPAAEIDHMDGDRSNNRWTNLREATRRLNQENVRKPRRDNQAGVLGVRRQGERFAALIRVDGRYRHLGTFDAPEPAHAAYVAAKRAHHAGNTL